MFCYQCEQTAKGTGCTQVGVCGKKESTAKLQDLILFAAKKLAFYHDALLKKNIKNPERDHLILDALFTTVTNVNFDDDRLLELLKKVVAEKHKAKDFCKENNISVEEICDCNCGCGCEEGLSLDDLLKKADEISIAKRKETEDADLLALEELLTYGLKGTAAYAHHALMLGYKDDEAYRFFADALATLARGEADLNELLALNMKCGEINLKVMGLLDKANTETYGNPEPTSVRITPIKGKAILVSGHDLKDLDELLKQTEGLGINVYTHGEMLPCNAYPALKKYPHLVGNYGGAWQDQLKEFKEFPGSILMTTNCIQNPAGYLDRIFTSGLVAWEGVKHIDDRNFAPVIEKALSMEGFSEDEEEKRITIGFGHNAVLNVADKVIDAVKAGKIRHFFLVGGCDGAKSGRNYYTDFAQKVPYDCVIMTLACGKYRFNKLEFGDIEGIPRLLDIGQCNDAYSAVQIAVALAGAFKTDVNSLPLSMILSWYEQKAVCILLSLLYLGIKNIRLGPTLPAFITPNVLNVLVEKFGIKPITTADEDLKAILG
ncbi:MAG: hydroxylamine reductase [bacterium]